MSEAVAWRVPAQHPVFAGHFPGTPIFPGVMLLDAVIDAIAGATGATLENYEIRTAKFLNPARPGDELVIEFNVGTSGAIRFEVRGGTRTYASGDIEPGETSAPGSTAVSL